MKILVAEDDLTSRTLLKTILVSWGFEVSAVADGEEAWKVLNQAMTCELCRKLGAL